MHYDSDPARPYGPKWKQVAPKGLPADFRPCSTAASGERILRAELEHDDDDLALICVQLARTESGCMISRAANIFDVRAVRGEGVPFVSAFGIFQWNAPCLEAVLKLHRALGIIYEVGGKQLGKGTLPHKLSPDLEIEIPLNQYRRIWAECDGWPASYRARASRLWHISPALYKRLRAEAKTSGILIAWAALAREWETSGKEWVRGVAPTINRRIKLLKFSDGSK